MASKTQITRRRRKRKDHKKGVARKRKLRRQGSTRSTQELFGE